jgi:hypothetical protein
MHIWIVCTAIFVVWTMCASRANYAAQFAILILGGSLASWSGPIIATHAKEQMADARSRLTPGFRTPHLVVAAAVFLLGVVGIAWYTIARVHQIPIETGWPATHVTLPGYAAIVLLAATMLAWMAHTQSVIFIFTTLAAATISLTTRGQNIVREVLAGDLPILAWGILGASTVALAALWWRWARMHEEMGEYWKVESLHGRLRITSTGDRYLRRAAALEAGWFAAALHGAYRLDSLANISAAPFWKRAARWRMVVANVQLNWLVAPTMAVGLLLVYWGADDHSRGSQVGLLIVIPAIMSLALPIMATMITWPQRWHMIAAESLRPVASRGAFFREQGAAMALEVANLWIWFTLGAFLPGLILRPTWILSAEVGGALMLTAGAQVWLFGFSVWVLRLRLNSLVNFLFLMFALGAAGAIVAMQLYNGKAEMIRAPSLLWVLGLIAVGLIIILDAYRRWNRTDLD